MALTSGSRCAFEGGRSYVRHSSDGATTDVIARVQRRTVCMSTVRRPSVVHKGVGLLC